MNIKVNKVRCSGCNSVLLAQGITNGVLEIRCRKSHCGKWNSFHFKNGVVKWKQANENAVYTGDNQYAKL